MTDGLGSRPEGFRSGFACVVGRPNVGKSTLLNQILRKKVAITSDRPQTTRNAIRGIYTSDTAQVVFVDTPGFHKPRTALGKRLNAVVRNTLEEVDAVVFVVDAAEGVGRGDAFLAEMLRAVKTPVIVAVNKTDRVDVHRQLLPQLAKAGELGGFAAFVPVSARTGDGIPTLLEEIVRALPEGPMYYPADSVTDQPEKQLIAELIREKALRLMREEVPHSVAVVVEEVRPEGGRIEVDAVIYVERDSQKGIVIGRAGAVLKQIGTEARRDIEALLGSRAHLHLRVKVEPDWQRRAVLVERFGYGT